MKDYLIKGTFHSKNLEAIKCELQSQQFIIIMTRLFNHLINNSDNINNTNNTNIIYYYHLIIFFTFFVIFILKKKPFIYLAVKKFL